jgi:hypothetical protein
MQEIGTSGSMNADGKRSVAAWPKLRRPSSTLPERRSFGLSLMPGIGGAADIAGRGWTALNRPFSDDNHISLVTDRVGFHTSRCN